MGRDCETLHWEEINEKDFTIIRLSVRLLGVVCPATDKGCMCRVQDYLTVQHNLIL